MRFLGAALVAGLVATGCTSIPAPTTNEIQGADYGEMPARYKEAINQYFQGVLKDPSSIQYGEVTAPGKGYFQTKAAIIAGGKVTTVYGWLVRASINAKNSYGGYVGFKTYTFGFRGEEIVYTESPETE